MKASPVACECRKTLKEQLNDFHENRAKIHPITLTFDMKNGGYSVVHWKKNLGIETLKEEAENSFYEFLYLKTTYKDFQVLDEKTKSDSNS